MTNLQEASRLVGKAKAAQAKEVVPMYLPMKQVGHMLEDGKKLPVHHMEVTTRAGFVGGNVSDEGRHGGLGSAYKSYFYAVVCFLLTVFTAGYSLYIAAVFAYLTGYFWSQRMVAPPWNITWFKGKALYHTV